LLVDRFIVRSGLPDTSYNREFALAQVLVNLITDQLARHRFMMAMLPPTENTPEGVETALRMDIKIGNPQLIDWSWLYYHYVRTDLNMSSAHVACIGHVDERTVRRYRQRGIRRLTYLLIEQEMQTKRERKRQLLYAVLPSVSSAHLFGRSQALHQAEEFLKGPSPHHIQIVGTAGIGKTALVQETLRSLIDEDRLDDLIWIDTPRSTQQIRKQLYHAEEVSHESISSNRVAVVLDNADYLVYTLKPLSALLAGLSNTTVFLTARGPLPLGYSSKYLHLAELDQPDALALIRSVLHSYYVERAPALTDAEVTAVWEHTGGNPRRIQHSVFNRHYQSPIFPRRCAVRPG
jgi:hypothetical protein